MVSYKSKKVNTVPYILAIAMIACAGTPHGEPTTGAEPSDSREANALEEGLDTSLIDPHIDALEQGSQARLRALAHLRAAFEAALQQEQMNRDHPRVRALGEYIGQALLDAYESTERSSPQDTRFLDTLVSILAEMQGNLAIPLINEILSGDITEPDSASNATEALLSMCTDRDLGLPPPNLRHDSWRSRCAVAEPAIPALVQAYETVKRHRGERGPLAENTPEEDNLAGAVVTAVGVILVAAPESVHRQSGIVMLTEALETPDRAQDLRTNLRALQMLGHVGDNSSIPALVRAIFIQGKRRPVALQEIARVSIQQVDDLDAVAVALVKAGRMQDQALLEMQQADPTFNALLIKEQVAVTLGLLGITSPTVASYLMEELNHEKIDSFDRIPSRGPVTFTPALSKAHRRVFAAQALGRLRYEPAFETIVDRLRVQGGQLVDGSVDMAEVPGYIDAAGDYLLPARTNEVIFAWAKGGDDALRDRAGRRLMLQADASFADRLEKIATTMPSCPAGDTRCVRANYDKLYVPTLRDGAGCTTVETLAARLSPRNGHWWTAPSGNAAVFFDRQSLIHMRERAAYQLALLSHGDPTKSDVARGALIKSLGDGQTETILAAVFAIDRLSPDGCSPDCLEQIEDSAVSLKSQSRFNAARRAVEALHSRLTYRSRRTNPTDSQ